MKQQEIKTINLKELGYEFHEDWEVCDVWVDVPIEWCSWENEKISKIYTKIDLMTDDELLNHTGVSNVFDSEEEAMEFKQLSKMRGAFYRDSESTDQCLVRIFGVMVMHNEWWTKSDRTVTSSMLKVVDYDLNLHTYPEWVDGSCHDDEDVDEE